MDAENDPIPKPPVKVAGRVTDARGEDGYRQLPVTEDAVQLEALTMPDIVATDRACGGWLSSVPGALRTQSRMQYF
jgi:hypothetical protein